MVAEKEAAKRFSSGSVITAEGVPEGHQIGIAWYADDSGKEIGFAYDEDRTDPADIATKVSSFCIDKKLRPFGDIGFIRKVQTGESEPRIEEIPQDQFLSRFGAYPRAAYLMLDEGGTLDSPQTLFGVPEDAELDAHRALRAEMGKRGLAAGLLTAAAILAAIAVLMIAAAVISSMSGTSYAKGLLVLLACTLSFVGAVSCIAKIPDLARSIYEKLSR